METEGAFVLQDLSVTPVTHWERPAFAHMFKATGSTDFALQDCTLTHGFTYLADLEPLLLLQAPLRSFFSNLEGFKVAHGETHRMALIGWFTLLGMGDLEGGEFHLPTFPWRTNCSGFVPHPRKIVRGIQDYGAPRRLLRRLVRRWQRHRAGPGRGSAPPAAAAMREEVLVPAGPKVRSLNVACGIKESKAARKAHMEAMGEAPPPLQTRHTPALRRDGEPYGMRYEWVPGLAEPSAPPEPPLPSPAPVPVRPPLLQPAPLLAPSYSWSGGRWNWPGEFKPLFIEAIRAMAKMCHAATCIPGTEVYVVNDDGATMFHQFMLAAQTEWACGTFRLDPTKLDGEADEATLSAVIERCMAMGVAPSSNWCQRLATEICAFITQEFCAQQEDYWRELEDQYPKFHALREGLRRLSIETGRDEARMFYNTSYTDDFFALTFGARDTVCYLIMHHRVLGPSGLNLTMGPPKKRGLGLSGTFIGGEMLTVGALAYIGPEKRLRTQTELAEAIAGIMLHAAYVSLVGLLNHLVVLLAMPYHVMYPVYGVLDLTRAKGRALDEPIVLTDKGKAALETFATNIRESSGISALASIFPVARPAASVQLCVMHSDAAVLGTGRPAVCGNLYNFVYIVPLEGYLELPIVTLEFFGAIFNVMMFAHKLHGAPALLVLDALVVSLVLGGKASTPMTKFLHLTLIGLPEFQLIEQDLYASHENGPYNPICDSGSRGKFQMLDDLMQHMGFTPTYVEVPPRAYEIMDEAIVVWRAMTLEEQELTRSRMNSASSGPSPYVARACLSLALSLAVAWVQGAAGARTLGCTAGLVALSLLPTAGAMLQEEKELSGPPLEPGEVPARRPWMPAAWRKRTCEGCGVKALDVRKRRHWRYLCNACQIPAEAAPYARLPTTPCGGPIGCLSAASQSASGVGSADDVWGAGWMLVALAEGEPAAPPRGLNQTIPRLCCLWGTPHQEAASLWWAAAAIVGLAGVAAACWHALAFRRTTQQEPPEPLERRCEWCEYVELLEVCPECGAELCSDCVSCELHVCTGRERYEEFYPLSVIPNYYGTPRLPGTRMMCDCPCHLEWNGGGVDACLACTRCTTALPTELQAEATLDEPEEDSSDDEALIAPGTEAQMLALARIVASGELILDQICWSFFPGGRVPSAFLAAVNDATADIASANHEALCARVRAQGLLAMAAWQDTLRAEAVLDEPSDANSGDSIEQELRARGCEWCSGDEVWLAPCRFCGAALCDYCRDVDGHACFGESWYHPLDEASDTEGESVIPAYGSRPRVPGTATLCPCACHRSPGGLGLDACGACSMCDPRPALPTSPSNTASHPGPDGTVSAEAHDEQCWSCATDSDGDVCDLPELEEDVSADEAGNGAASEQHAEPIALAFQAWRALTSEERNSTRSRLNSDSSGPSPYVEPRQPFVLPPGAVSVDLVSSDDEHTSPQAVPQLLAPQQPLHSLATPGRVSDQQVAAYEGLLQRILQDSAAGAISVAANALCRLLGMTCPREQTHGIVVGVIKGLVDGGYTQGATAGSVASRHKWRTALLPLHEAYQATLPGSSVLAAAEDEEDTDGPDSELEEAEVEEENSHQASDGATGKQRVSATPTPSIPRAQRSQATHARQKAADDMRNERLGERLYDSLSEARPRGTARGTAKGGSSSDVAAAVVVLDAVALAGAVSPPVAELDAEEAPEHGEDLGGFGPLPPLELLARAAARAAHALPSPSAEDREWLQLTEPAAITQAAVQVAASLEYGGAAALRPQCGTTHAPVLAPQPVAGEAEAPRHPAGPKRRTRCNKCANCLAEDCGTCGNCIDMPKFGGLGTRKQTCVLRACMMLTMLATPSTVAEARLLPRARLGQLGRSFTSNVNGDGAGPRPLGMGRPLPLPSMTGADSAEPRLHAEARRAVLAPGRPLPLPVPGVSLAGVAPGVHPRAPSLSAVRPAVAVPSRAVLTRSVPIGRGGSLGPPLPLPRVAHTPEYASEGWLRRATIPMYGALPSRLDPPLGRQAAEARVFNTAEYASARDGARAHMRAAAGLSLYDGDEEQRALRGARMAEVMSKGYASSTVRKDKGHWAWWSRICVRLGTVPKRSDMMANAGLDADGQREEIELAVNALIIGCVECRPRAKKDPEVDPRSVLSKLKGAWRYAHTNYFLTYVSLSNVVLASKGLLREYIERNGVATLVPERKRALTNQMVQDMLRCPSGSTRGNLTVRWGTYRWQAIRACFSTQAESGERKDETAKASKQTPHRKGRLSFDSLRFKVNGEVLVDPSDAQLDGMCEGDGVLLSHGVCKNDPFASWFAATPSFLAWRPLSAGRCACRELVQLYQMAKVLPAARASTPLFGPSVGEEFTHAEVEAAFKLLLVVGAGVLESELRHYSIHSFRIFAACALLDADCPRWMIKRLLRWRGDDSIDIYARVNDDEWAMWGGKMLTAQVDSSIASRLPQIDVSQEQLQAFDQVARSLLGMNARDVRPGSADM